MPLFNPPFVYPMQKPDVASYQYPVTPGTVGSGTPTANTAMLSVLPFAVNQMTAYDRLAYGLTTAQAGGALMAGMYAWNGGRAINAARLLDMGALDLSAGSGTVILATIALTLTPGFYWMATWLKDSATSPTGAVTSNSGNGGVFQYDAALTVGTSARALRLASAYPASMPAALPAGLVGFNGSVPAPMLRVLS